MKLSGAQRLILQTIQDAQGVSVNYVNDVNIAQITQIPLQDVRDWLVTLEEGELIALIRTTGGYSAFIEVNGRLALSQFRPLSDFRSATSTMPQALPQMRTILFLAANPKGTPQLRLDEEVKKIEQGLERARKRDQFRLIQKWAVTDDDLRRALLDHEPEIVHFSGHGSGVDGLNFEDDQGHVHEIPVDSLARLFKLCSSHVKCVVLNACYSVPQAEAISQHIDHVVGMKIAIGDEAAVKFAVGFYDALGAGRDFETAFEFGKLAIDLRGIPEREAPVIKMRPGLRLVEMNREQFCDPQGWERLSKIGRWDFDQASGTITGSGVLSFLLSHWDYGRRCFVIRTKIKFFDFERHVGKGTDEANAGIVLFYQKSTTSHDYYNLLITRTSLRLEEVGGGGGTDYWDFKHLSPASVLELKEGEEYDLAIMVSEQTLDVHINDGIVLTHKLSTQRSGKVGIRPWRSRVEITFLEVTEF
jgi:hypothetical protein